MRFSRPELSRLVQRDVEALLEQRIGPIEDEIRGQLSNIIRNRQEEVYETYERRLRNSSASPEPQGRNDDFPDDRRQLHPMADNHAESSLSSAFRPPPALPPDLIAPTTDDISHTLHRDLSHPIQPSDSGYDSIGAYNCSEFSTGEHAPESFRLGQDPFNIDAIPPNCSSTPNTNPGLRSLAASSPTQLFASIPNIFGAPGHLSQNQTIDSATVSHESISFHVAERSNSLDPISSQAWSASTEPENVDSRGFNEHLRSLSQHPERSLNIEQEMAAAPAVEFCICSACNSQGHLYGDETSPEVISFGMCGNHGS